MEKSVKTHKILSFEVDSQKQLRLHSLFNLFQDVADLSASSIGVGYDFCCQNNLGWVAFSYHVKIEQMPVWRDEITLETWPSGTTAVCGIRDFRVKNGAGDILISASSQWALIDTKALRPASIAKHLPHYEPLNERALLSDFSKIQVPNGTPKTLLFPVHRDDIDMNRHVNNALYPTWCLDCLDDDFLRDYRLGELQIFFKKPIVFGTTVAVQTYAQGEETVHVITDEGRTVEFARVKMNWVAV